MKQKVQFTETVLRDANQSLIATRLPYSTFEAEAFLRARNKAEGWSYETENTPPVSDGVVPYEVIVDDCTASGNITLSGISDDDAVMIMAVVANHLHRPLNKIRFKSIDNITERAV